MMRAYPKILLLIICFLCSFASFDASGTSSPFINLDEKDIGEKRKVFERIRTPQVITNANYQMTKDVTEILENNKIPYWITFGTFMGAVRNQPATTQGQKSTDRVGGPFQWDDDIDLGVKVEFEEKILGLKDVFRELGYDVFPDHQDIVGLKVVAQRPIILNAGTEQEKKFHPFVDLFLYELEGDHYVLNRPEGKKIFEKGWYDKSQIDQLQQYPFGPLTLWGPSDATHYFVRMYGSAWNYTALYYMKHYEKITEKYCWTLDDETRIPSLPSGRLEDRVNRSKKLAVESPSAEHTKDNSQYWNRVYDPSSNANLPTEPSSFVQFVVSHPLFKKKENKDQDQDVLELGCGNGRDSFFLAPFCDALTSIDASEKAIESNITLAAGRDGVQPTFKTLKIESLQSLEAYRDVRQVYARFFIHAIPSDIEKIVLDFFGALKKESLLFLEYRTTKDPLFQQSTSIGENEGIHGHYRRFINHEEFLKMLEEKGYVIKFQAESDEFSVLPGNKPVLGRVIAQKTTAE